MLNSKAKDRTAQLKYYNRGLFRPGYNSSKQDQLAAEWADKELAHQRKQEEMRAAQDQRVQGLHNAYEENNRKALGARKLGGQKNHDKYSFEDDDGQQAERLDRTEDKISQLADFSGRLNMKAQVLSDMTEHSLGRLRRMDESVSAQTWLGSFIYGFANCCQAERARDGVVKNHAAMKRAAGMDV